MSLLDISEWLQNHKKQMKLNEWQKAGFVTSLDKFKELTTTVVMLKSFGFTLEIYGYWSLVIGILELIMIKEFWNVQDYREDLVLSGSWLKSLDLKHECHIWVGAWNHSGICGQHMWMMWLVLITFKLDK